MRALVIVYAKALEALERSDWRRIALASKKFMAAVLLSFLLFDLSHGFRFLVQILKWQDWALCHIAIAFGTVYTVEWWKNLYLANFGGFLSFFERFGKTEHLETAGVPIDELVDFLWNAQNLSRDSIRQRFGLSRSVSDSILERLEKDGVAIRGGKNARILSEHCLRSELVSSLLSLKI